MNWVDVSRRFILDTWYMNVWKVVKVQQVDDELLRYHCIRVRPHNPIVLKKYIYYNPHIMSTFLDRFKACNENGDIEDV